MLSIFILIGLMLVINGIAKAVVDTLAHHYHSSIFVKFKSWDPTESWKNKYKNRDPLQGPKFFLSTTMLVSLTDAWHAFEFIRNITMVVAIGLAAMLSLPMLSIAGFMISAKLLHQFVFHIFYHKIFT